MYPTGLSPVDKDKDESYGALKEQFEKEVAKSASGKGDNRLTASHEMEHVEGEKPSPFLSTTSNPGGTVNPQGESFGSSLYTIDLAYLPPSAIAATYSDRGMGYFLLSAFKGKKEEKAALIEGARKFEKQQTSERAALAKKAKMGKLAKDDKAFSAQDAAKQDPTLSGKEWQALMDVIRTGEILINSPVPKAAMKKK